MTTYLYFFLHVILKYVYIETLEEYLKGYIIQVQGYPNMLSKFPSIEDIAIYSYKYQRQYTMHAIGLTMF